MQQELAFFLWQIPNDFNPNYGIEDDLSTILFPG
jgi:hypothetical protein